jgi:spermidine/putrescine transport system ATP-binding protein
LTASATPDRANRSAGAIPRADEPAPDVEILGVTKRFGDVTAVDRMDLRIERGEFYSLLGPSGCGKTTTLRMIAGFEQPSEGEILLAGEPIAGIPPYKRNVNTVFQHYALFPHMDVARNVGYGLRQRKVGKADEERRVSEALALVRLSGYERRRTWEMSGGQQQRVALARALVNHPTVLLLDEPLGALDRKLRHEMQVELKALQQQVGITFVYVTHDQEEALTMSDVIVVMDAGRIQQLGSPERLYQRPVNRFVAGFIGGSNFVDATLRSHDPRTGRATIEMADGRRFGGTVSDPAARPPVDSAVTLAIRPERLDLRNDEQPGPADVGGLSEVPGRVTQGTYLGDQTEYRVATDAIGDVIIRRPMTTGADARTFGPGEGVIVVWHEDAVLVLVA